MKLSKIISGMLPDSKDYGFIGAVGKEPYIWNVKTSMYERGSDESYSYSMRRAAWDHCSDSIPFLTKDYFKENEDPAKYIFIKNVEDYFRVSFEDCATYSGYFAGGIKVFLDKNWSWIDERKAIPEQCLAHQMIYKISDQYAGLLERIKIGGAS